MSAHTVVVQFYDGRLVSGVELRRKLSADIFLRQAHFDLVGSFAQAASAPAQVEPVLHNLLVMKSSLLCDISAALFIFDHDPAKIREIRVAPSIAKVVSKNSPMAPIVETPGMDAELISRKTVLTTIAKAIVHRFYRLRRKPYVAGKALVRAWVDVTLKMYAEEVKSAQVRVFPFPLNMRRQKEFVYELKRRRIDWARDGLPYRISALGRLLATGSGRRPLEVAKFEHDAFAAFASEVARDCAGPVYTSDEFEVGAVSAGHVFQVSGINYINSAHGVGIYCPRTAYSHFRFLTKSQESFYRRCSPNTHFLRRETENFSLAPVTFREDDRASVVFVHQDFRSAGLQAEADVEEQIMFCLDDLKLPSNVSKYIKIHPNADPRSVGGSLADCRIATQWNDIEVGRRLFLIINSTSFYDLMEFGDIVVFEGFSFSPEMYLEGEYSRFDLKNLSTIIQKWIRSDSEVEI